ncbi:hypothetical protein [Fluviicola taffensis]|uniref:hypothetical protein n=1 Tax=Fluviicola taffensis TaxID=191579 RepID=UPI0031376FA3
MIKYLFCFGWIFAFEVNAQNAVSVRLEDVVCQLKSYRSLKHISDSLEDRIRVYDDSITDLMPRCTISWDKERCDTWNSEYLRMTKEQERLVDSYFLTGDSMNNEVRKELRIVSGSYCLLHKIDLFFTSAEPPLFGILPKDVSEEFATYILSLE